MGLLDVLNGMQQGPRGPGDAERKGGMSPLTMAMLALLAWKAYKKISGQPQAAPSPAPAPSTTSPATGGGLGGFLGGLLTGGAAGSILSGGLGDLLQQMQNAGHGDAASTWVSQGPNKSISPNDLANALGADQISAMVAQSGLSRDELLQGLSQHLPEVINHLTPEGRLPNDQEAARML